LAEDKELRISMGKKGRELVEKELSWRVISQRFIDIALE
jgi:glycosyltransferase involved in cell wall biosynthesis